MNSTVDRLLYGIFNDEEDMKQAAHRLREDNVKIYDFYTPCPVHGLDELLEIKRTRLPIVCFFAAFLGFSLSLSFQIWTFSVDWPLNVGGKSFLAIPAYIPVTFEMTVLFGALISVAAFFYRGKLFPGKVPCLLDHRITDDAFVMAIKCEDASINTDNVIEVCNTFGAREIKGWGVN